ncbi:anchor protein [Opitutaceae bacterium TAV5]|nr:anchor protein [Opitutaceae bacterium TAV5]
MITTRLKNTSCLPLAGFAGFLVASLTAPLHADIVNAVASGEGFTTGTIWGEENPPSSANDYFAGSYRVETPSGTTDYTFGGKSLTLNGSGVLAFRGSGVVTIEDFRFGGTSGQIQNWSNNLARLAGKITVTSYGIINPTNNRTIEISSLIQGTGYLNIRNGTVQLTSANTYSGGTDIVFNSNGNGRLEALADGALGTGKVRLLDSGVSLKLSGGITHDYINDNADLQLHADLAAGAVELSFVGTDIIGRLSLDGGASWITSGTYGSLTSDAQHKLAVFSGDGILQVGAAIPEASASVLIVALGTVCATLGFRRRRCPG